jgi:pimeloyl-ACP methyl ester carboxylesterase
VSNRLQNERYVSDILLSMGNAPRPAPVPAGTVSPSLEAAAGPDGEAGRTALVTAPALLIAGRQDRLFSSEDAERLTSEIGARAELLVLPEGNHSCANVSCQHRPTRRTGWQPYWLSPQGQPEDRSSL